MRTRFIRPDRLGDRIQSVAVPCEMREALEELVDVAA